MLSCGMWYCAIVVYHSKMIIRESVPGLFQPRSKTFLSFSNEFSLLFNPWMPDDQSLATAVVLNALDKHFLIFLPETSTRSTEILFIEEGRNLPTFCIFPFRWVQKESYLFTLIRMSSLEPFFFLVWSPSNHFYEPLRLWGWVSGNPKANSPHPHPHDFLSFLNPDSTFLNFANLFPTLIDERMYLSRSRTSSHPSKYLIDNPRWSKCHTSILKCIVCIFYLPHAWWCRKGTQSPLTTK